MRVLVLGGKGESTNAVINALLQEYKDCLVILEDDVPARAFFKRRIKSLGIWMVFGQILFLTIVPKKLKRKSARRLSEIADAYHLDYSKDYKKQIPVEFVNSVNSDRTIEIISEFNPDIVVVNGTRIISGKVLDRINVPVINMHTGITPKYRGVHGGYWAVVNDDEENCGVTIHFVNTGIDTGNIIQQARIPRTEQDNYITYPRLQTGEGIQLELSILRDYEQTGIINTTQNELPSMIWSHPTIFQYLKNKKKSR